MTSNIVVGILVYLVPFLVLVCICMCCTLLREKRRNRAANIRQCIRVPTPTTIINPVEQSSIENNSPPPPYTAEPPANFDESLPTYERAINRHL